MIVRGGGREPAEKMPSMEHGINAKLIVGYHVIYKHTFCLLSLKEIFSVKYDKILLLYCSHIPTFISADCRTKAAQIT